MLNETNKPKSESNVSPVVAPVIATLVPEAVIEAQIVSEQTNQSGDEKNGFKSTEQSFHEQCKIALQDVLNEYEQNHPTRKQNSITGKIAQTMSAGLFNKKPNFNIEHYTSDEELRIIRGVMYDINHYEWGNIDKNDRDAVIDVITGCITKRVNDAADQRSRHPETLTPEHDMKRYETLSSKILTSFTQKIPELSYLGREMKRKAFMDNMLNKANVEGAKPKTQKELKIFEEQVKLTYETALDNLVKQYTQKTESNLSNMFHEITDKGKWKKLREAEEKDIFYKLHLRFMSEFNVKNYWVDKTNSAEVNQAIVADINSAIDALVEEAKQNRAQQPDTHHLGNENNKGMKRYDGLSNKIFKSFIEEIEEIGLNQEKAKQLEEKWIERRRLAGDVMESTGEAAVMLATGLAYAVFGILYVAGAVVVAIVEADDRCHHHHHHYRR